MSSAAWIKLENNRTYIEEGSSVAVIWTVDDVYACAKDNKLPLPFKDQAIRILQDVVHNHDAEEGINWTVLAFAISKEMYK